MLGKQATVGADDEELALAEPNVHAPRVRSVEHAEAILASRHAQECVWRPVDDHGVALEAVLDLGRDIGERVVGVERDPG